jgi:xanthine dehydrogenase molybdopterin-binding subunit B
VDCQRVGGAFGGKMNGSLLVSVAAALCSWRLRCPVRVVHSRTADMIIHGNVVVLY